MLWHSIVARNSGRKILKKKILQSKQERMQSRQESMTYSLGHGPSSASRDLLDAGTCYIAYQQVICIHVSQRLKARDLYYSRS